MKPGNTFTHRSNSRLQAKRTLPGASAYMADYERQRRYYFRDEDNSGYRRDEQSFESVFVIAPLSMLK